MMSEIPQNCKGDSVTAYINRLEYMNIKLKINDLIKYLS